MKCFEGYHGHEDRSDNKGNGCRVMEITDRLVQSYSNLNSMYVVTRLCHCSKWKSTIPFGVYLVLDPQAFVDFMSTSSGLL